MLQASVYLGQVKILIYGQGKTHGLQVSHLYGVIKPAECSWRLTRQSTADSRSPARHLQAPPRNHMPGGLQLQGQKQTDVHNGGAVIVRLAKKDARQRWPELRKSAESAPQWSVPSSLSNVYHEM